MTLKQCLEEIRALQHACILTNRSWCEVVESTAVLARLESLKYVPAMSVFSTPEVS